MQPSALIQATFIFVIIFSTTSKVQGNFGCSVNFEINKQGTLACNNNVNIDDQVTICQDQTPVTDTVITKQNEGRYSCCCGDTCQSMCAGKDFYGEQTRNDNVSNSLEVKWGNPINIPCAYTPGKLINEDEFYTLKWVFDPKFKVGTETLFPLSSNDAQAPKFLLDKEDNTISAGVFNPLKDQGSYECTVVLLKNGSSSSSFTINVTEATNSLISTSITSPPASQITSIEDGTAQFNCLVQVPSYKTIGFKISDSIDDSLKQEIVADMVDDNCILDGSTVNCALNGPTPLTLSCSYDTPNQINCSLIMRNLTEKNSSMISCFVVENPGVVSKKVNLFIKPQLNCLSNNSTERIDRVLNYTFEYPITVRPVTMLFAEDGGNTYIEITADLYNDNKTISVQVPNNISMGHYRILFNGSASGISCPFNFSEGNTKNVSSTPTISVPISSTTTGEVSSTPTDSDSITTSVLLTETVSISPSINIVTANLPLEAVVGASVSVFVLVVLVMFLVFMLVFVTKISGRRKREEYRLAHEDEPYYTEKGNQLKSMTQQLSPDQLSPDHLSPEQSTQCDSCSHASTYTFITDDPSPRHHQPSHSSRSSHSRSSNSCPSTSHLKNKPLPRYGIPDHYPQYQMHQNHPTSLPFGPNPPDITVITPTPTMEDQPVLEPVADCMSPTGTEPFSSPNTPASDDRYEYFTSKKEQSRPSDLPISPLAKTPDSSASTPLSDQTMIGVLLYLQHKDCDKKENCQMCKLISRHFERIAKKYGENVLKGMVKNLNTPGGDGTLKHLRKREKKVQRIRSPHRPQVPSLAVTTTQYQRQRSHSASHIDEEELTFSSTETDDDSLKPSNKRVKPIRIRKAVTDDEKDEYGHQRNKLPLQRISEISVSDFDLPSTLSNCTGLFPGGTVPNKGSESDSTDGSTSSRMEFDSSKPSGLSMSFMKSPETSLPVNLIHSDHQKNLTLTSYNSSSGYETDNVFDPYRSTSNDTDERGDSPPQHVIPNNAHHHVSNGHLTSRNTDAYGRRHSDHRPIKYTSNDSMSHSVRSDTGSCYNHQYSQPIHQSDYSKALSFKRQAQAGLGSNLSNNGSRALSMRSSPGGNNSYWSQSSNGSNQSNHSIHSESALQNYPRTQKQLFSSPPGQRKTRTPSPIQVVLPKVTSSATPI